MHPLNVYGYHVRFGHSVKKQDDYRIIEEVCFGTLFNSYCKSKYYRIFILKDDADLKKYHSNYCFFDKKQIKNHLKQIPKFCFMKFDVKDAEYKGDPAYQIDFYIDSDKRIIHKYVLTWIRSLFEWPFYLYLTHAQELHKLPEFKFESVVNLFNVVANSHKKVFNTNIHTFGVDLLPFTKKQLKENIEHVNRVNNVFNHAVLDIPQCQLPNTFEEITPELFEANKDKYIEAYHIIKNYAKNHNNRK